jgi:hypothetical protein
MEHTVGYTSMRRNFGVRLRRCGCQQGEYYNEVACIEEITSFVTRVTTINCCYAERLSQNVARLSP